MAPKHPVTLSVAVDLSPSIQGTPLAPPVPDIQNVWAFANNPQGFLFMGLDSSATPAFGLAGTFEDVAYAFPADIEIKALSINGDTAPGVGTSFTFHINVEGVDDPGLVLVLDDLNTSALATGSVLVSAGDRVCISIIEAGVPVSNGAIFAMGFS